MSRSALPLVLIPGVLCNGVLWQAQVDDLGDVAHPTVTEEHTRHTDIGAIAGAVLAGAPEKFALAGLSFGGYIAFEIMRRAPHRVDRLALLVLLQIQSQQSVIEVGLASIRQALQEKVRR